VDAAEAQFRVAARDLPAHAEAVTRSQEAQPGNPFNTT
jgi:hypothetical protein